MIRLTHWSVSPTVRLFECLLLTNKVQIYALNKDLLNICSISNTFRFLLFVTCILLLQPQRSYARVCKHFFPLMWYASCWRHYRTTLSTREGAVCVCLSVRKMVCVCAHHACIQVRLMTVWANCRWVKAAVSGLPKIFVECPFLAMGFSSLWPQPYCL